ncbi:MAG: Asp-tRNA(Asn)/Glu-tRNA(Gln) amidotransferase subunit GatC [Clostridiales bacterium]|nr:Asp-tRNA(Asn)/Glu-tRNA(Gln) amidotransferase subunit GatC [Clostridiales bacterium]
MDINVKHLAKLSMLKMDEKQLEKFEKDMQDIVKMVQKLPKIQGDLISLDPENPMILREDKLSEKPFTRAEILSNAPEEIAGCIVVPKTLES